MGAVQGIFFQDFGNKRGIVELVITSLAAPLLALLKAKNASDVVHSFEKHRPRTVRMGADLVGIFEIDLRMPCIFYWNLANLSIWNAALQPRISYMARYTYEGRLCTPRESTLGATQSRSRIRTETSTESLTELSLAPRSE